MDVCLPGPGVMPDTREISLPKDYFKIMQRILFYTIIVMTSYGIQQPLVWAETATEGQLPTADDLAQVDANEILAVQPVDQYTIEEEATSASTTSEYTPYTPETLPPGEPYPIAAVTPIPTQEPTGTFVTAIRQTQHFFPYVISAYIPELDRTEVNLGMLLHDPPGIETGISWGATREMLMAARMTVQSSSYTAGVNVHYALRSELPVETKPGIAILGGWRFVNFRTNNEERETIFSGNRILTGVIFSKGLGSLGRALESKRSVQNFMDHFNLHVAALMEYQSGRRYAAEDVFFSFEFGARTTLEIMIDPECLFLTFTYDSLPDWLGSENYYCGIRYLTRDEFAVDVLGGRIGNDFGVNVGLAWIF
ncbi:hypothetical protein KAR34_01375 [bacterium]|nr:hypothetical protein [bacterium]